MKPLILMILLLSAPLAFGQNIYFYRPKESGGAYPKTKTAIYCNGVKLASLGNNRIFAVDLSLGKYSCSARDKKEPGIELEVEAGKTYFVRGDMDLTRLRLFRKPNFRLTLILPEQAKTETPNLIPITERDIKDPRVKAVQP